ALAVTEPDVGSDVAGLRTVARRDGSSSDSGWVIDGSKLYITNAGLADVLVVLARTPDDGERSISAFVVDLPAPGVTVHAPLDKLGWRASETNEITLDSVRVGPDAMLGPAGGGFTMVVQGFNLE